jgi:Ca2+-binding RTX toxin-like protein
MDHLEARRLLSVQMTLVAGHLNILGDAGVDEVRIRSDRIIVNGTTTPVTSQIKSIYADLGAGHDCMMVDFSIENASVTLKGGAGNDMLAADTRATLFGGDGDDVLLAEGVLVGGAGNDYIESRWSRSEVVPSANDYIDAGSGNDTIVGNAGNDTIYAGSGNDRIETLAPDFPTAQVFVSKINAGSGHDKLYLRLPANVDLGSGDDRCYFELIGDREYAPNLFGVVGGGDGRDWIQVRDNVKVRSGGVAFKIFGDAERDTVYGSRGNDLIMGGDGNDYLFGDGGSDTISGEAGNDSLFGGTDDDILHGGSGVNVLVP